MPVQIMMELCLDVTNDIDKIIGMKLLYSYLRRINSFVTASDGSSFLDKVKFLLTSKAKVNGKLLPSNILTQFNLLYTP